MRALVTTLILMVLVIARSAHAQIIVPPDFGETPDFEVPQAEEQPPEQTEVSEAEVRNFQTTVSRTISSNVVRALRPRIRPAGPAAAPAAAPVDLSGVPGLRRRFGRGEDGSGILAAWAQGTATFLDRDTRGAAYDGTVTTPFAGMDYVTPDGWVFGVGVGGEFGRFDTAFNNGSLDSNGAVITPYVGKAIGPNVIVDAAVGYARIGYDLADASTGTRAEADYGSNRFFTFANVTGFVPAEVMPDEALSLSGRFGISYSHQSQEDFTLDGTRIEGGTVELGQLALGVEANYALEVGGIEGLTLVARAEGRYDFMQSDTTSGGGTPLPDDRTDVALSAGVLVDVTARLSAELSYERVLLREDLTEQTVLFGLRMSF